MISFYTHLFEKSFAMIRSSNTPSPLRRWWRRQAFYRRRLSAKWIVFLFVCIILLIRIIPNPFSSEYERKFIDQDVPWNRISELLETKETIYKSDVLSNQVKVIHHGKTEKPLSKSILILLYTNIFQSKKYCHLPIDRIFGSSCPSKNRCQWSCNSRQLAEADAIIFHAYDIQYYQAHVPNRSETKPKSIWILWSDEPPSVVNYSLFKSYEFNWTISYKLNSEVSIGSYGFFSKRELTWSNSDYNRWIVKQFDNRLNGALWFVSNCDAKERLQYYYDLLNQVNTTVEGYGRCVDYYPMHLCTSGTHCEHNYMAKYKFYLSFESTTCRDYITEKFYKAFYHGLIPIVYGAHQNDYNNFAPPHSFIHINKFNQNMNQLANYLRAVHSNFELYSRYHQWRKKYDVIIDKKAVDKIRMCELCERLNRLREDDVTYYQDIQTFFHEKC